MKTVLQVGAVVVAFLVLASSYLLVKHRPAVESLMSQQSPGRTTVAERIAAE